MQDGALRSDLSWGRILCMYRLEATQLGLSACVQLVDEILMAVVSQENLTRVAAFEKKRGKKNPLRQSSFTTLNNVTSPYCFFFPAAVSFV